MIARSANPPPDARRAAPRPVAARPDDGSSTCVRSLFVTDSGRGLALYPFRALRPAVGADRLGALLCPPYDVIDEAQRARLLAADPANAVGLILPEGGADRYARAAARLDEAVGSGLYAVDPVPALYVYEMADPDAASATRGLLGAVELRDPADGVILPHENTMAGPVSDRLALLAATATDLEPIYLVYDGGGDASSAVQDAATQQPLAEARTADGVHHRLWAITDPDVHASVAADLQPRRALIADGHHRYATYRAHQQQLRAERGAGPWDRGLTLLVDALQYGPQVHAIHRVLHAAELDVLLDRLGSRAVIHEVPDPESGLADAADLDAFALVLANESRAVLLVDEGGRLAAAARGLAHPPSLAELDVTVLHRVLVEQVWAMADTEDTVGYAHSASEALATAAASSGTAALLRPTPVTAVAAVAASGGRMPRKSTLFTPKPASGLVLRRFADEAPAH